MDLLWLFLHSVAVAFFLGMGVVMWIEGYKDSGTRATTELVVAVMLTGTGLTWSVVMIRCAIKVLNAVG
jgi:hypothetical protein